METPLGSTTTKSTGVNASYMRYADILLMYAEAVNEIIMDRLKLQRMPLKK